MHSIFIQTSLSLSQCLDALQKVAVSQEKDYKYKAYFDRKGNELFHKQLELYMSREIFPYVQRYLESLAERGEIAAENTELLAHFLLGGQMAVINQEDISLEERFLFLQKMIVKIIK